MKILLVGALAWNPERFRSLHERGHQLWGLWSRSMPWDQGPYPALDGIVREISLDDAPRLIREQSIDCIYCLFQEYDPRLLAPPTGAIKHDISTLIGALLLQRQHGLFDVPIIRHWGFDIHQLDPAVAFGLDAHIFCNREKFDYFTQLPSQGGCGLKVFPDSEEITFLDSDRPKEEFMNDDFSRRLSDSDREIHTVCIGRPLGIDYLAAARHGIHVHIYSNNYDKPTKGIEKNLSKEDSAKLCRFIHFHSSLQTISATWSDVQQIKSRWVPEFSQYDAGWSYIGDPFPWKPLENRAAIPNRLSTYLLAGLPIITDRRTGFYRYNEPRRLSAAIEFEGDYGELRERLEVERRSRACAANARRARHSYCFDATVDSLIGALERARIEYFSRQIADRKHFHSLDQPIVSFGWGVPRRSLSHRLRVTADKWFRRGQSVLRA